MLGFILMLLIAALVGWIADMVVPGDFPLGWLGSIVAGLVGAYIGGTLLGALGPQIGGIYLIPAIIGAIIFSFIVELLLSATRSRWHSKTMPAFP